jgi:DNA helicase-2/ATP-dependent DNA helicase PcrA
VDDFYQSDVAGQLEVGSFVEHEDFGRGTVISVAGKGEEQKAVVEFSSVGRKNLLLKWARLRAV